MLKTVRIFSAALLALLISRLALAVDLNQRVDFRIPAQSLSAALIEFSHETRIQVIVSQNITGQMTQGITGLHAISEALSQLLGTSGLRYSVVSDSSIVIARRKATPVATHGPVGTPNASGHPHAQDNATGALDAQSQALGPSIGSTSPDAATSNSQAPLTEIVVTAQRRRESIQSVPISMTAFSQQVLDDLNIKTLSDLASVVPGLVVTTPGDGIQAYTDIAIRGIYSNDNSPTTAIYINDTPVMIRQQFNAGYSGSPEPDIFDLQRVEVLRGPQGTLFGASAMGGAIRYITHPPDMDTSSGYTKADVELTDRGGPSYDLGAAFGAPIVPDHLGYRASAWYQSTGGFVDLENPYSGAITRNANTTNTYVLQGSVGWLPVEWLNIIPGFFIQHHRSDNSDQYWLDRSYLPKPESGRYVLGANIQSPVDDDLSVYTLAMTYALNDISLEFNTSYVDRTYHDIDDWVAVLPEYAGAPAGPVPGLSNVHPYDQNDAPTRQWQQEFRLVSQLPDSRFGWVLGFYFRRTTQQTSQHISTLNPITLAVYDVPSVEVFNVPEYVIDGQSYSNYTLFTAVDEEKALFGNLTWNITSRLQASAGVRVERSSVIDQKQIYAGTFSGTAYGVDYPADQKEKPVTPRIALTYRLTPDIMAYINAGKGFRPGGSNSPVATQNSACQTDVRAFGLQSIPGTYGSDSLWSYEVGTKESLFDRHLVADASAFYVDWKAIQTDVGLNCGNTFTTNLGKTVSQGFDLQLAATPLPGLQLLGNVGYTHAYHVKTAYGDPYNGATPILDLAGQPLGYVIPWTAAFSAEYSWSSALVLTGSRSYIRADYRYLDTVPSPSAPGDSYYNPVQGPVTSDAYHFLNLRLGLRSDCFDVSVYVDNLTHSHPRLSVVDFAGLISNTALRPLTTGITGVYRF